MSFTEAAMATIPLPLLLPWLRALQTLPERLARRRRERDELCLLARLGERDLRDLGLSRSDLPLPLRQHPAAMGDTRWS